MKIFLLQAFACFLATATYSQKDIKLEPVDITPKNIPSLKTLPADTITKPAETNITLTETKTDVAEKKETETKAVPPDTTVTDNPLVQGLRDKATKLVNSYANSDNSAEEIKRYTDSVNSETEWLISRILGKSTTATVPETKVEIQKEEIKTQTESKTERPLVNATMKTPGEKGEMIRFNNDGNSLAGFLYKPLIPKKPMYPVIVVLHGSHMGTHDHSIYQELVKDMNKAGVSVFVYDRRGSGLSGGDIGATSFMDLALDASAAIDELKKRSDVDPERIGLYGISQGAWIAGILNTIRIDIDFNVLVSASTMNPADQMNFAAFTQLKDKNFSRAEIDSALRIRGIVDNYYRGKTSYEEALPVVLRDTASRWYKEAFIFDLVQPREKSRWYKQMNFDPMVYFKAIKAPTLVLYGDQDIWVSADKGLYDWKELNFAGLETKRIPFAGHFMIDSEKENPANPQLSGMYRNLLESFARKMAGKF